MSQRDNRTVPQTALGLLDKRYVLREKITNGGFGVVYRAWDLQERRPVAIKMVAYDKCAGHKWQQREHWLRKEAKRLKRAGEHPNVVAIHRADSAVFRGHQQVFVVMTWLAGGSLYDWLRPPNGGRRRLDERAALELLMPAIAGVANAHEARVIHRDLKPLNLIFRGETHPSPLVVVDFGLSKVMPAAPSGTEATNTSNPVGSLCGTRCYRAPEQLSSHYGRTCPATDVFALGLIFTELVAGHRALLRDGDTLDPRRRPTPRRLGAAVTDACEEVWSRALALHPRDRHRDAGQLLAACQSLLGRSRHSVDALPHSLSSVTLASAPPTSTAPAATIYGTPPQEAMTQVPPRQQIVQHHSWPPPRRTQTLLPPTTPPRPHSLAPQAPPPSRTGRAAVPWLAAAATGLIALAAIATSANPSDHPPIIDFRPTTPSPKKSPEPQHKRDNATVPPHTTATKPAATVHVPAGPFLYGSDTGFGKAAPAQWQWLPAFDIHQYEVTVDRYRQCVQQGSCTAPVTRYPECNWPLPERENHPINCVTWKQANSFCAAHDMRLPSEQEWEKAARGPAGYPHSWGGDDATCSHAVLFRGEDGSCGINGTLPVGSKPKGRSPYGAEDMIGNVWEWTASTPTAEGRRILRGASWGSPEKDATATHRFAVFPHAADKHVGFRCVHR